jgi:hypothetical protein
MYAFVYMCIGVCAPDSKIITQMHACTCKHQCKRPIRMCTFSLYIYIHIYSHTYVQMHQGNMICTKVYVQCAFA